MPGGTDSYLQLYKMLESFGYRLLDPTDPSLSSTARMWGGGPEEWDILAVQAHHMKKLGI